jgi:hypothetical protein
LSAERPQGLDGAVRVFFGISGKVREDKGGEFGLRGGASFFSGSLLSRLEPEGFGSTPMGGYGIGDQAKALCQGQFWVGPEDGHEIFRVIFLDEFRKTDQLVFHRNLRQQVLGAGADDKIRRL